MCETGDVEILCVQQERRRIRYEVDGESTFIEQCLINCISLPGRTGQGPAKS